MPLGHDQVMDLEGPDFIGFLPHNFGDLVVDQILVALNAVSNPLFGNLLSQESPLCVFLLGLVLQLLE